MNIECAICKDLLVPIDDVYHTPCGHIFHFQCLTNWFKTSSANTCPQCREKTTARNIHRIYFNFSSDNPVSTNSVTLLSQIDSLNFKLTLAKKEATDLIELKNKLELQIFPLKQEIKNSEEKIKSKDNIIDALREQIKYYKIQCADVSNKDKEIKMLNGKLAKLQSMQALIDASTDEVESVIKTTHCDFSTLQTYALSLKRELENSAAQRRRLRDKVLANSKVSAELFEVRGKLRQLETTLKNEKEENAMLQAELLKAQTATNNCKCNKIVSQEEGCLEKRDKYNSKKLSDAVTTEHISNVYNKVNAEIEDGVHITKVASNAENTPQNIKSQGFFSMTNRNIKRNSSSTTVPSILTKKPKLQEQNKRPANRGMTFDGFGGHAKYDTFPKPF